jgi:hypothetical protein
VKAQWQLKNIMTKPAGRMPGLIQSLKTIDLYKT